MKTVDDEIERAVDSAAARQASIRFSHLLRTLEGHCSGTILVDSVMQKVTALARARGVTVEVDTLE